MQRRNHFKRMGQWMGLQLQSRETIFCPAVSNLNNAAAMIIFATYVSRFGLARVGQLRIVYLDNCGGVLRVPTCGHS